MVKSVFGDEVGEPLTALPIGSLNIDRPSGYPWWDTVPDGDWFVPKNTRAVFNLEAPLRSEEHTSELQSLMRISYAVFCLKKKEAAVMTSITKTHHSYHMT